MTVDNRFHAQSMIEELRYWAPSVNDVARGDRDGPRATSGACSWFPTSGTRRGVELKLRKDGLFDIEIAGDAMEGLSMTSRDMLAQLLDRIAEGFVLQHRW